MLRKATPEMDSILAATAKRADLAECDHMLLYLNALTWTSGEASCDLAAEIAVAMSAGVPVLLAHEMPGIGGQAARHGVAFGTFFASDATPMALLKAGIYSSIAVALKGGEWREASMVMMADALAAEPTKRESDDDEAHADLLEELDEISKRVCEPPALGELPDAPPAGDEGNASKV